MEERGRYDIYIYIYITSFESGLGRKTVFLRVELILSSIFRYSLVKSDPLMTEIQMKKYAFENECFLTCLIFNKKDKLILKICFQVGLPKLH